MKEVNFFLRSGLFEKKWQCFWAASSRHTNKKNQIKGTKEEKNENCLRDAFGWPHHQVHRTLPQFHCLLYYYLEDGHHC